MEHKDTIDGNVSYGVTAALRPPICLFSQSSLACLRAAGAKSGAAQLDLDRGNSTRPQLMTAAAYPERRPMSTSLAV